MYFIQHINRIITLYLISGCDNVEILAMLIKNGAKIDTEVEKMLLCTFGRCRS